MSRRELGSGFGVCWRDKIGALAACGWQPALDPQAGHHIGGHTPGLVSLCSAWLFARSPFALPSLRPPPTATALYRRRTAVVTAATQHRWRCAAHRVNPGWIAAPPRARKKSGCFLLCSLEWSRVLHDSGLSFEHNSALARQSPRCVATCNKLQASTRVQTCLVDNG